MSDKKGNLIQLAIFVVMGIGLMGEGWSHAVTSGEQAQTIKTHSERLDKDEDRITELERSREIEKYIKTWMEAHK